MKGRIEQTLAAIALFPLLLGASLAAAAGAEEAPPVRFGEIIILRKEVFNPSVPGHDRILFRFLNNLHIVTRENIIRQQLLFKTGMPFDASLLEESERILRRFEFIGAASIVALEEVDGLRSVVVETMDQWSTNIELEVDRLSDKDEEVSDDRKDGFELTLSESNSLGYGKRIRVKSRIEGDRSWFGYLYEDPLLFDTRWILRLGFQDKRKGEDWETLAFRPFYSLSTRWSMGAQSIFKSEENLIYRDDREIARFFQQFRKDKLFAGRMYGTREKKLLAIVDVSNKEEKFVDLVAADGVSEEEIAEEKLPVGETGPVVIGGLRSGRFRFVKENRIEQFVRVEDVELGSYAAVQIGRAATGRSRWILGAETGGVREIGTSRYGSFRSGIIADRREGEWGTTEWNAEVQYHGRLSNWNTLAGRISYDRLWRSEPGTEIFAGENTGLRGFEAKALAGQSRLLFNLEDRLFTDFQFLTVAFGGALFVDAGTAWDDSEKGTWKDISSAAGGGLRFGLTKSKSSPVLRIDVARNFRNGSWRFSVASGQLFRIIRPYQEFLGRFE